MGKRQVPMHQLSLGWLTLPNATPEQLIIAAAAGGFSSVGMRIVRRPSEAEPQIVGNEDLIQNIILALKSNGISLLHMGGIWLDGNMVVGELQSAFETGAKLGAHMCVAIATPNLPPNQLLDDFTLLCELASQHDMRVAAEFALYSGIKTIEDTNALIDQSGQSNAGILVDALHLYRSGGSAQSLSTISPDRIYFAQLCDAHAASPQRSDMQTEARGNRLDPGFGELPLVDFVRALPAATPIEMEVPCLAYRNFGHVERAKIAGDAARAFLQGLRT